VIPKPRSGKLTLRAIADRKFGIKEMQPNRGYYILVARQNHTYPPAFRWQIMRRGEPMGVQIGGDGFPPISPPGWRAAGRWQISLSNLSERRSGAIDPSWSVGARPT